MNQNTITVPFTFDGKTLHKSNVSLTIDSCAVEGVDFCLPPKYGLLMLKSDTKIQAQKLLNALSQIPLTDAAKRDLADIACEKDFQTVWSQLEQCQQYIPTDEPKFYAELCYKQIDKRGLSLVSKEKAYRFYATDDLIPTILNLPLNVYKPSISHCLTYTGFGLSLNQYQSLLGREKEFMGFVEELYQSATYTRGNTCNVCYRKYFENSKEAFDLLREIQSRAGDRARRDQVFEKLEKETTLEFAQGTLVHCGWSTFYVSKCGEAHRLCYRKNVELREAVLKAYEKGKLPTKLDEETDKTMLKRIADTLGKTHPELALIILP